MWVTECAMMHFTWQCAGILVLNTCSRKKKSLFFSRFPRQLIKKSDENISSCLPVCRWKLQHKLVAIIVHLNCFLFLILWVWLEGKYTFIYVHRAVVGNIPGQVVICPYSAFAGSRLPGNILEIKDSRHGTGQLKCWLVYPKLRIA